MNSTIWKITMFCLAVSVLGLIASNKYQKKEIEELQTTVARQANTIQQLEKERNNLEVTIPSNNLPGD